MKFFLIGLWNQLRQFWPPLPGQSQFDYANRTGFSVAGATTAIILDVRMDNPEPLYLTGWSIESTIVTDTAFFLLVDGKPAVDGVSAPASGVIVDGATATPRGIRHRISPPAAGLGIETLSPLGIYLPSGGRKRLQVKVQNTNALAALCRARITGYTAGALGARNERE